MLSPDEQVIAMGAIRDQIIAAILDHERTAHGGQPCLSNRASVVAFIAHCLGVRDEVWNYAQSLLVEHYDAYCPDPQLQPRQIARAPYCTTSIIYRH
jgi:hypothetical protein